MSHAASEYVKHLRQAPNGDKITPAEKAILCLLADDHNQDKGFAWPAVGNLAMRACMTPVHCRRPLRSLEAKGVLETNPRLRENGGRSSSEYRFVQIDPPFDVKSAELTRKRMTLQLTVAASRPKQQPLYPPNTDVRGTQTSVFAGGEQRSVRGANTDVRGARTPLFAQDPLLDPLTLSGSDPSLDPEKQSPLPPVGGNQATTDEEKWENFKRDLKSDLLSVPPNVAKAKGFTVVQPSEGAAPERTDNDFHVCFRDWWLREARLLPNGLVLITEAADYGATQRGIAKYQGRLTRLAQWRFLNGKKTHVTFKLLGAPARPVDAAPLVPATRWTELCAAVERALGELLNGRERNEAMTNFRAGTEGVTLGRAQAFTNPQVWTLHCPNPKKTAAVLGLYQKHVRPAAERVAGRRVEFEFRPYPASSPGG